MQQMAAAMAQSKLFGMKTAEEVLSIMLVAQANGQHPAAAARDYDVIQGRASKKSEAMLRDFLAAGGKVEWHEYSDKRCDATFSHPQGGSVRVDWDMARATKAGLAGKDNYKKFARNMFRARCISEGVRTVCPVATGGLLSAEEARDLPPQARNMGAAEVVQPEMPPELLAEAEAAADKGMAAYGEWWAAAGKDKRKLLAGEHEGLKTRAQEADATRTVDMPQEVSHAVE
jgi:hypothetical protein